MDGQYEYNIKDHLGNLRVAFRDNGGIAEIVQANSYGIWGEDLPTLSYSKPLWKVDNFKFTGKENLQGTGFIDFGARWYDNIVPRFITVDPLAELSRRFSPTVFANNNPQSFIDPDGMRAVWNGKYGSESGYNDNETGESRSWGQVQGEYGIGGGENDKGKGTRLIGTTSNSSMGNKIATGTLAFITADAMLPDPTDVALPKWAAYGVAGAAAGTYLYSAGILEKLKNAFDPKGFKYVTYTKASKDGFVYVGRSSGYESPEQIVRNRDYGHHMNAFGYGKAVLSTFAPATVDGGYGKRILDPAYWSIRGSEQLQIEFYRNLGISGNDRNGISPTNDNLQKFLEWGRKLVE